MRKVENVQQLRAEIKRLKIVANQQEQELKISLKDLENDWKPVNILWTSISNLTGISINKNDFLKNGMAYGFSLFIQQFIFKSERKMEQKIYNFAESAFEKIKKMISSFTEKGGERNAEE